MKRIATLLILLLPAAGLFAQPFAGVSWIGWENEPDYEGVTGYADNPYANPVVIVPQAPEGISPDLIIDPTTFDLAWQLMGDANYVNHLTSNGVAGDPFDLEEATPTFGAAWKAVHDGANLYVFLKYMDVNSQADDGSRTFEIMAQPTSHFRHEGTFQAASDSAAELVVAYQNMAYARYTELGGGKAMFADGAVSAYEASQGLNQEKLAWKDYVTAGWGNNEHGLLALASATHFWNVDGDNTIRAILVMSFDGALGYPVDPADLEGDYNALQVGDTIAFDVKSNSTIGGTEDDNKAEYFWASDKNNGYGSNYYSGYLVMAAPPVGPTETTFAGVSWIGWENEPDYEGVTGYADNPYDTPEVTIKHSPDGWTYDQIVDATTFDLAWEFLGDPNYVANLTSNGVAGDPFDLEEADPTFGAAWKGVHDGSSFYVFLKYWDVNGQTDDGSRTFEVMAQPTSPLRHETTFEAASDSAAELVVAYQNMAYARYTELGGGKAMFTDGAVSAYEASQGLNKEKLAWKDYVTAGWGNNENGLLALASATHFWNVDDDGTIRAIMVMSFDGALAYPSDPADLEGDYTSIAIGETFAFDVKSNSTIGGGEDDNKVEYFWASDKNNGYGSNYYSGNLTLSDEVIQVGGFKDRTLSQISVYVVHDVLNIKGIESTGVKIYSITGSLVKSVRNVSRQVDMSDVSDGVYIVKLEGVPSGFKVVK
jgi:hypothetical protein